MSLPSLENQQAVDAAALRSSSHLLIVAAIFVSLFIVYSLYRCSKHSTGSNPVVFPHSRFISAQADRTPVISGGLDVEVLKSLSITIFKTSELKGGLECSVCLADLVEGQEVRILPECGHGFHVNCIDTWFKSHATCPLCRASVNGETKSSKAQSGEDVSIDGYLMSTETPNLPTDQAGNGVAQEEGSSSSALMVSERVLAIDIHRSKFPAEESKTPQSTRSKSFRRLLSSKFSPMGAGDIENAYGTREESSKILKTAPETTNDCKRL